MRADPKTDPAKLRQLEKQYELMKKHNFWDKQLVLKLSDAMKEG